MHGFDGISERRDAEPATAGDARETELLYRQHTLPSGRAQGPAGILVRFRKMDIAYTDARKRTKISGTFIKYILRNLNTDCPNGHGLRFSARPVMLPRRQLPAVQQGRE